MMTDSTDLTFEMLWEQMHTRLCRFICGRLSNGDDAEDILQEVFLRIHNHLDSVRDVQRLESWMYQIARNSIIDYYRARRQWADLSDTFPVDEEAAERFLGEEGDSQAIASFIREIIESLPEPYREALILTEYQGLSQQELASRQGISLSGAKSRVQRARQKVKEKMLQCCHFAFDSSGLVMEYRQYCTCCCEHSSFG